MGPFLTYRLARSSLTLQSSPSYPVLNQGRYRLLSRVSFANPTIPSRSCPVWLLHSAREVTWEYSQFRPLWGRGARPWTSGAEICSIWGNKYGIVLGGMSIARPVVTCIYSIEHRCSAQFDAWKPSWMASFYWKSSCFLANCLFALQKAQP